MPENQYDEEDCIKALQRATRILGESPSINKYNNLGIEPSSYIINKNFDGWNNAKESAGLNKNTYYKGGEIDYTDEELIEVIRSVANKLDRVPKSREFEKLSDHGSYTLVVDRFGSWNEGLEAAGLEPNKSNEDKPVHHRIGNYGYRVWNHKNHTISVHRLTAVAIYGFDDVRNKVVHHKDKMKLNNSHENLELVENQSEHASHHTKERNRNDYGQFTNGD